MKTLNITFTDAEYAKLEKSKQLHKNKSWHEFVLRLCSNGVSIRKRVSSGSHPHNKQKPQSK
jgi:predicted CopG family antitoxin